jgi:hypothetical protein
MAIPILIDPRFIERLIIQTFDEGLVPEIEGRIGKSNLMHACYKLRFIQPPRVIATNSGSLVIRVPMEGHISIPWGWGKKFSVDAEADLIPSISDGSLHITVGEFEINTLSVGEGCSFPRELLRLLGPFIKGAIFPSKSGSDGGIAINVPVITIPLSSYIEGVSEVKIILEDVMISEHGLVVYIALPGEARPTLPPQPTSEGFDIAVAVPEKEAQRLIEGSMGGQGVIINGETSKAIPDQTRFLDLLMASGETLTSFGRRGLGRRALRSSSQVKVNFSAQAGAPVIEFLEGNRIFLHGIAGHLVATATVDMDMPTGGLLYRLKSFFVRGNTNARKEESKTETMKVAKWSLDEDFLIREVLISVALDQSGKIEWKVDKLEIDLNLKWYLPERTIEELLEFIGGKIATSQLPQAIPTEMPLPGDIPIRVIMDEVAVTTIPGTLFVRANMHIAPLGQAEKSKEAVKELVEEQITNVLKNGL